LVVTFSDPGATPVEADTNSHAALNGDPEIATVKLRPLGVVVTVSVWASGKVALPI
jgi:hypothetical protein